MAMPDAPYTATVAFLETLSLAGIDTVFVNPGSDHPSFLEAMAAATAGHGRNDGPSLPKFVSVTHEMVALSAAQGYYQATGRMAACILHVDCGLLNAGGAIHNLARSRCPVLVFSGMSSLTLEGELTGSRTEFINWVQDVHDMPGIVRNYSKYSYEFRTGRNVPQVTMRAIQLAMSEPRGPVYLFGAREILEETIPVPKTELQLDHWSPIQPSGLIPGQLSEIVEQLTQAQSPLVITSWVGNDCRASAGLLSMCETLSIPILDSAPFALNCPAEHPLYLGSHWSGMGQHPALANADLVVIVDSDVPYIPIGNRPNANATIIHIDSDPLKNAMPLFYLPAKYRYRVKSAAALEQINEALAAGASDPELKARLAQRKIAVEELTAHRRKALNKARTPSGTGNADVSAVGLYALGKLLPRNTFVLSEAISNYAPVLDHLGITESQRFCTSGASSLGWHGGAAVGAKLGLQSKAKALSGPGLDADTFVCAVTGDGSFMFSVPSTVHHFSSRNNAPFLTIVLSNGGWKSPKLSAELVHPNGFAAQATASQVGVSFGDNLDDRPDYSSIAVAAAGGPNRAFGARVVCGSPGMEAVFKQAIEAVQSGKSAVVELLLPQI